MIIRPRFLLLLLLPTLTWGATDSYRLSWRTDPATSMVIGWNQISGTNVVVCYGTVDHGQAADAYQFKQAPDRVVSFCGMKNSFARLKNLKPDTAYYFVIRDSEGVGRRLWFRTAPATPKPITFIAGGDSRTNPKQRRDGNTLVSKLRPLFILFGGDYTYSGKPKEWQEWLKDWQLIISKDGRIYPIIAVHGNHENRDLLAMSKLFDSPNPDQYYSFGFGGDLLRIWVLNSELASKKKASVPKQQAWIKADLPRHPETKWKMVAYHRPMRPHGARKAEGTNRIKAWAQLFYDNGVDVIVESDTHVVKRTYPVRPSEDEGSYESFIRDDDKGMVFIGEGSWAAPARPDDDDKPWTMASDSFYQFKWIQLSQKEMLIRTVTYKNVNTVVPLTEENLFQEPQNMVFWTPETGKILRLPFNVNHPSYTAPRQSKVLLGLGGTWDWSLDGKTWQQGVAPLGYGDPQVTTSCTTTNALKPQRIFFRKTLMVEHPEKIRRLFFHMLIDDGCVVKLNGKEAIRYNMPKGKITAKSHASKCAASWRSKKPIPLPVNPTLLKRGKNTIEVQVFQYSKRSSDIVFDLAVRAKEKPQQ